MQVTDTFSLLVSVKGHRTTVLYASVDVTVTEIREKAVQVTANGRPCWFPRKALKLANEGCYELAAWFRTEPGSYQASWLDRNVEWKYAN